MVSHGIRVSASVVLALRSLVNPINVTTKSLSKNVIKPDSTLKVLTLRRGQNDKMLPGADVFPGGNAEASDFSLEWLDLFAANGFSEDSFDELQISSCPLPGHPALKEGLPPWLGFRLSAIRETFEECGILLCRFPSGPNIGWPWTSYTDMHDIEDWQKRVRDDPNQMLALCQTKGCVPDVWGLHTWSNWMTPPNYRMRHNTVFYIAVLHSEPPHFLDLREMDKLMWTPPKEILESAAEKAVFLLNPQMYEISRLAQFSSAESLAKFASKRSKHGCPTWMPVVHAARDGLMFILPGDSDYPEHLDEVAKEVVHMDLTIKEALRDVCERQGSVHRCMRLNPKGVYCDGILVRNYKPTHHHVLPVTCKVFTSSLNFG